MGSHRFSYVKYDLEAMNTQQSFKDAFEALEAMLESSLEEGRPKNLALTALEESYMWIGKSIRDSQIARTGKVEEQKERGNE